jgi:hypothetical protein
MSTAELWRDTNKAEKVEGRARKIKSTHRHPGGEFY